MPSSLSHIEALRCSCDKTPPWVNNEWSRPISSKFSYVFCCPNKKKGRSHRGNELFSTQSRSPPGPCRLINHAKHTRVCVLSSPWGAASWTCARNTSCACVCQCMDTAVSLDRDSSSTDDSGFKAPEQEGALFKPRTCQLAPVWPRNSEPQFTDEWNVMMITSNSSHLWRNKKIIHDST